MGGTRLDELCRPSQQQICAAVAVLWRGALRGRNQGEECEREHRLRGQLSDGSQEPQCALLPAQNAGKFKVHCSGLHENGSEVLFVWSVLLGIYIHVYIVV